MWQTLGAVAAEKLLQLRASNEHEGKTGGAPVKTPPRQCCLDRVAGRGGNAGGKANGTGGEQGLSAPRRIQHTGLRSLR